MMDILPKTAGAAMLLALAMAPQAGAQTVLSAPDAVRACVCRNLTVTQLAARLNSQRQNYTDRKNALDSLEQQASAAKQHLNVDNLADREALGRLLDKRDAARENFAATVTPRYNASVQRYDAALSDYDGMCLGKSYDPATLASVRASALSCPPTAASLDPRVARED
jgi:hypothetical protein